MHRNQRLNALLWYLIVHRARAITHEVLNAKVYIMYQKEEQRQEILIKNNKLWLKTTHQCLSAVSTKTIIIAYGPFSQIRSHMVLI